VIVFFFTASGGVLAFDLLPAPRRAGEVLGSRSGISPFECGQLATEPRYRPALQIGLPLAHLRKCRERTANRSNFPNEGLSSPLNQHK
jgi:hypothetical protein